MVSYNFALAALIALVVLACNCRADLINDVCAQTENPSLCTVVLRSDPRSKFFQTYRILAEIAIDKAQLQSRAVAFVAKSTQNAQNKVATQGCVVALNTAYGSLEQSKSLLKLAKDKNTQKTLEFKVLEAWASSIGCDARFAKVPQPPALKQNNDKFLDMINIIRTIVFKLV